MRSFLFAAIPLFSLVATLPSTHAADRTGVTDKTIKIGMFGPLTGSAIIGAKALYGAAAIYKDVNDKGGVNGRKIELVIEDDTCDRAKGVAAARKLVETDKVFMLHGAWCSAVAIAVRAEVAKTPNLPYMVIAAASTYISAPVQANLFHPVATTKTVAEEMVRFALTKPKVKTIAIISHSDAWGKSHLEPAVEKLKSLGLMPVETAYLERGQTDANAQALSLKAKAPDVVLAFLYPEELAVYLRDAYKHGLRTTTLGTQGVSIEDTDRRVGIPGAVSDLHVFFPLSVNITDPALSKYARIFKKYNPAIPLDTVSFIGMSGALAVVDSIKRLGPNVTRERLIAALNKIRNFDPGIQSGPMTFTASDHAGIKRGKMVTIIKGKTVVLSEYPAQGLSP